jgi:ATP-dependent DNA helicase HFM1/MER3
LNEINADKDDRLRYHILENKGKKKKRIQTREEKIFILANDCLTGDPSAHDLSLVQVSIATSVFIATGQHSYVLVIQ